MEAVIKLSQKSQKIDPSPIRAMAGKASKLDDVVSFAIGEPDFTTPPNIVNACIEALKRGETHYAPNKGIELLRRAVSDFYAKRGLSYDPEEEVIVTNGGLEALLLGMSATLDPGDEVIISNPYWSNHREQIKYLDAIPVEVPVYEKDGFAFDPENLKQAITAKTRMIVLNYPSNPTGGVASKEVLTAIAELAIEHDLVILSDDVYECFCYDGEPFSIASLPGMKERTIICNSFSKSYAMTGWRVGFACAHEPVMKMMVKLQEDIVSCIHTPSQFAAAEALNGTREYLDEMIARYTARRRLLVDGLNRIDGISCIEPAGAFYAFANITGTGLSSVDFAERLLDSKHVVVVPGSGFGSAGEGFIRLSYATSEEAIEEGLARMQAFVKEI
ncbi:MAG: pyridoxal phosphate-dependent aminotransferase [Clostridiales Family XIII bacterium]|jgi:aminotransferase|nr:pyridoxal phosphate-dependent aminotransferase [Clostridiales Family XIII bacterium]